MNGTKLGMFAGLCLFVSLPCAREATAQSSFRPETMLARPAAAAITPFQPNNGVLPPPGIGPLFKLSVNWPKSPAPPIVAPPWRKAINDGLITTQNAAAYAAALKAAIKSDGRALITKGAAWDAASARWYNEPWTGWIREALQGTYTAGEFGPGIFPKTGLRTNFNTHVMTYYNERAAYTLSKVWGADAMKPNVDTNATQFDEGAIIVKAAVFASTDKNMPLDWWDALNGAQVWDMYLQVPIPAPGTPPNNPQPVVWPGYVTQFDIIVKDSQSAPKTGWVFMTLVYDRNAPGDIWDKMVPLGVQWGNDPQATQASMPLTENWNNPQAPLYATQTLGWGGRLTGPNDGGRNNIAVNGVVMKNAPNSSCMSCHSTAQWNVAQGKMVTFLLPSFPTNSGPGFQLCGANGKPDPNGTNICSPAPGSADWMKWYQNRLGTSPMDAGSVATDFDLVLSFKSLRYWSMATQPTANSAAALQSGRLPSGGLRFNQYTGAPMK